jgi:hypothetical protein
MRSPLESRSPWEKLTLATSIPASTSAFSTPGEEEAGPIVQTIFVFLLIRGFRHYNEKSAGSIARGIFFAAGYTIKTGRDLFSN